MTALKEFDRLEATGLWRSAPTEQRREVIVSLGDATLTISDTKGQALAHWSIAATLRSNGNATPAIYHPDGDPDETLELPEDEMEMINGIDKLLRTIERRRPKPGKLRLILGLGFVAALIAIVVFWVPPALERYAVNVVPPVKRTEIGMGILQRLTRVTGAPCSAQEGRIALNKLGNRVLGFDSTLSIVPDGVQQTISLPGKIIVMNRSIVEDYEDPDVTAGFVLAEYVRGQATDPLAEVLDHAGLMASLRLLTTGSLPDTAIHAYAEHLLTAERPEPNVDLLIDAFRAKELRSSPYGYAKDITGETTLPLIEADPRRAEGSRQVLSDGDWLRLQAICER